MLHSNNNYYTLTFFLLIMRKYINGIGPERSELNGRWSDLSVSHR